MNDDQFDIDDDMMDEEDQSPKATVKKLWNENPVFKIIVIAGGIIIAYLAYSFFFTTEENEVTQSRMTATSNVTAVPGEGGEVDQEYREAVEEANTQRASEAEQTGGSSVPTLLGSSDARIEVPDVQSDTEEDPLEVWRQKSEALKIDNSDLENVETGNPDSNRLQGGNNATRPPLRPAMGQMQPRTPQQQQIATSNVNPEMTERFAEQMRVIIGTKQPPSSNMISTSYPSPYAKYLNEKQQREQRMAQNYSTGASGTNAAENGMGGMGGMASTPYADDPNAPNPNTGSTAEEEEKVLLTAGTVVYAQIINALNSDLDGPVLAHILSGPMAGGRAIGSFNRQNEYLIVEFDRVALGEKVYSTSAYALDADTTLTGVRTDIDRHWVRRVVLPAAAEFIAGMGAAIAETNETTVTVDGGAAVSNQEELDTQEELAKGVERGADRVSEILEDEEDVEVTVTLKKGTPVGLLFVDSVTEGDAQ